MVFADLNIIYIAAVLLLCAAVFLLARKEIAAPKRTGTAVIVGLLLAAAPISVFFVVDNGWLSLRGTVMSFCGLALIIDALASEAAGRLRRGGTVTALIAAVLALIFCTASVSELSDYRGTTIKDREFVSLLETKLKTDGVFDSSLKIAVLGVEPSYLENQNYYYHEHIHGVTQSGWALTGALEWQAGRDRPEVTPMPMSPMYEPWNKDAMRLDGFDGVYVYLGGELVYVSAVKSGEDDYLLIGGHDEYLGRVWSENGYGYLELDGEADWNGAKK